MNLEKKVVTCKKCGKNVSEKNLRDHMYTCGKEKSFWCDACDYRSYKKYRILLHLQGKHVELFTNKKLKCSACYLEFKNAYFFDEHVKKCVNQN